MKLRAPRHTAAIRQYRSGLVFVRQLTVMVGKELMQLWRDRPLMFFIAYIFTMNVLTAGGESRELRDARLVVYDADRSEASRGLIYGFRPPYFKSAGEVASPRDGLSALDRGYAVAFLDIPRGFQETLRRGSSAASVQMHVDTSKATRGYLASSYGGAIVARFAAEWSARHNAAASAPFPVVTNSERTWYNPAMNDAWFSTIGELLTMMTVACILLPGSAMVRERERGTIEQLLVSPLTPLAIVLAKMIAMTIVMLGGTALALYGIMQPVFHVPFRGSVPLFFALTALFSLASAGLGVAAATFARNSAQVGMMVLLLVMPIIVLSGTWNPIESLPPALRYATMFSPLRHYVSIAYGIILRGEGMDTLWGPAASLGALGAGLFVLAMWRFRRQFV